MNDLATGLLWGLARTTVILAMGAVAVHGLLRLFRASSPTVHRAAWCLVLVLGWLWFRLPVEIPWYEVPQDAAAVGPAGGWGKAQRAPETTDPMPLPTGARFALPQPPTDNSPLPSAGEGQGVRADANDAATQPLWPVLLAAVWLAGMGLLVAGWLGCYTAFLSLLPRGQRAEKEWIDQWDDLRLSRGVRRAVPMRVTARMGPVLCRLPWGYQLLVPGPLWARLDAAGRLGILRHELAHLERGDVWKSLGVRLLALPHWFNPLAWWAVRRFDEAAEWACDQAVCGSSRQARPEYAKALVVMGETAAAPALFRPAAGRGLSQRIRRLLDSDPKEDSLMKKLLVLGAALTLALLCLIRFDLVAKEPAEAVAQTPPGGWGKAQRAPETTDQIPLPTGARFALPQPPASESKPAAKGSPAGKVSPTDTNRVPAYMLTYDGKSFDQWRDAFRIELNPARRAEAIKALAAFGARGYGKEAAEAIVAAMRDYAFRINASFTRLDPNVHHPPVDEMKYAAVDAFSGAPGGDADRLRIPMTDALPILIRELKQGPPNGRHFAICVLRRVGREADTVIPLADVVKRDKDTNVRMDALGVLVILDRAADTAIAVVCEAAKGEDRTLAAYALGSAATMILKVRWGGAVTGETPKLSRRFAGRLPVAPAPVSVPDRLKPLVKLVIEALHDKNPVVRGSAVVTALQTQVGGLPDAAPALVQILEKGDREDWHNSLFVLVERGNDAILPVLETAWNDARQKDPARAEEIFRAIERVLGYSVRPDEVILHVTGAANAPGAGTAVKTPSPPPTPTGKAASEEKKAEPPR